jgi:hypothetical protein
VSEVANKFPRAGAIACIPLVLLAAAWAAKEKSAADKVVDAGSFGVYNAGHRIATETFSIKQGGEGSVVSSEFKSEQGEQKAEQSSNLELTPSVELRRYEWKELSPGKTQATVSPSDTFLIERFGEGASDKQHEQNFLLPTSTSILDDYFFVHREVLAWKYLATACKQEKEKGGLGCPLGQKIQFGTLNPHARSSMAVSIEFTGKDKVTIRGAEREFSRFILRSETGDWAFWLDDQFKLMRLLGEGGTEVVRD